MPRDNKQRIVWTIAALQDIIRLRNFIEPHNPDAAHRAAKAIKKASSVLMTHPEIGRMVEGRQEREIIIPFGVRGYVMRYIIDNDAVVILRVWHSLEDR